MNPSTKGRLAEGTPRRRDASPKGRLAEASFNEVPIEVLSEVLNEVLDANGNISLPQIATPPKDHNGPNGPISRLFR